MKKRLFSVLLSLCMVLALFPATAFAQEPDSLAIIVSGFQVGKTPADCKVNFVSTIPGVTFSADDIQYISWEKYAADDDLYPMNNTDVFRVDTRYRCVIQLDNNGLTEVPAVTVNGKTPQDCYLATSNGEPVALFVRCEFGTPAAGNEDREITVNGSFVPGAAADEIISADIAWDAMDFTYTGASQGTWNPVTHTYEGATEGGWSNNTPAITVTNHSNVAVNATLGFTANVTGVVGTFTEASGTENDNVLELATAEGTEVANAPTATANFGISGAAIDADKTLGTITVTIAKVGSAGGGETATVVTTFAELQDAVNNGNIVLASDVTVETPYLAITKDVSIDFNGNTMRGSIISTGNIGDSPNNLVLRDTNNNGRYSIYSEIYEIENGNGQAAAIIANQTNITIESGKYTNNNAVILCAQLTSDPNDVGVMINGGTFDGRDGASVIVNVYGNVIVNDGEFNAYHDGERFGACVHLEPGITYIPSITTINGGTFNADKSIFYVNVDTDYTQKIIVNGGTFNVAEGGSLIEVSSGNASDYLTIIGGTFNVDPSAYVDANTYTVTDNGDGKWTVAEK